MTLEYSATTPNENSALGLDVTPADGCTFAVDHAEKGGDSFQIDASAITEGGTRIVILPNWQKASGEGAGYIGIAFPYDLYIKASGRNKADTMYAVHVDCIR